jgi:hypothetical protein
MIAPSPGILESSSPGLTGNGPASMGTPSRAPSAGAVLR